jgi:hypothetical protein
MCALKFSTFEKFPILRIQQDVINIHLRVKYQLFLPVLMKIKQFSPDFLKIFNIKFNENPSSGSQPVPCVQIDMAELMVTFHNFPHTPRNSHE